MDKSTRINMLIRGHIQRRLREEKFDPEMKKLEAEQPALAVTAYCALYTEKERELMLTLPKGFMQERASINVRLDGEYHCLSFGADQDDRVHMRFKAEESTLYIKSNHHVGKAIRDWGCRKEALKEKRDEALRQAGAFISSHRTVGSLIKAWPEVVAFLPPNVETATTALALPVKQLNRMLGL